MWLQQKSVYLQLKLHEQSLQQRLIAINISPDIRHLNNPLVWILSPEKTRSDLASKIVLLVRYCHMILKMVFVVGKLSPLLGQQTLHAVQYFNFSTAVSGLTAEMMIKKNLNAIISLLSSECSVTTNPILHFSCNLEAVIPVNRKTVSSCF